MQIWGLRHFVNRNYQGFQVNVKITIDVYDAFIVAVKRGTTATTTITSLSLFLSPRGGNDNDDDAGFAPERRQWAGADGAGASAGGSGAERSGSGGTRSGSGSGGDGYANFGGGR